jgi:hypothetical protein
MELAVHKPLIFLSTGMLMAACNGRAPTIPTPPPSAPETPPTPYGPPGLRTPADLPAHRTIAIGDVIQAAVEATDVACAPNWDASGRCALFQTTSATSGQVEVRLRWDPTPVRPDDGMDLFLVYRDGSYLVSYAGNGASPESLTAPLKAGETVRIWAVSYYGARHEFVLELSAVP